MKVLINIPSLKLLGGVANHYLSLKYFWRERVKYNVVGKRGKREGSGVYWLPWDILKFVFKLMIFRPDIVLINPSLKQKALRRDFLFLNIARFFGFKVVVFFHGFNWDMPKAIDEEWIAKEMNKASLIFVLAKTFKDTLIEWRVSTPIVLSTTKVDDNLVVGFDPESRSGKVRNVLFLARIEKAKGIYEAIEVFELLKVKYPFLTLTIVGNGSELSVVREYAESNNLFDINIKGELRGKELIGAFTDADLYLLPSYHEGMPTSVLEAMAFGLPVITRNVGGLPDFFENGKMGYITDSLNPLEFANAIIPYIDDATFTRKVSLYNQRYAKTHFMASHVAKAVEEQLKRFV